MSSVELAEDCKFEMYRGGILPKVPRVLVVGSSNTDMVVKTARIPAPGETVLGGEFVMTGGGKGANQAVAAARLGAEVSFLAKVGTDIFGDRAIAEIAAAGVNTDFILRDPEAPSGVALIFVEESGQNSIVVAPGANARLTPDDVHAARSAFEYSDVVVLQFEIPIETVARAIQVAKELGKQVIVNPAPATDLPAGVLKGVDVLTPNEIEAAMILELPSDRDLNPLVAAHSLVSLGIRSAVVTIGSRGAVIAEAAGASEAIEIPGYAVSPLDTTAAGDCFTGALAVGLAEGMKLPEAASFANAAAALSVRRFGAQVSMPSREEVERFLQLET